MTISSSHLEALKAFGYTEPEARFLYLVATHSGYFVARQFLGFTGSHWDKRTTTFWAKLHSQKHARTECFSKSSVIDHRFSRCLYRQLGWENLRNRREHEIEFIRQRIAIRSPPPLPLFLSATLCSSRTSSRLTPASCRGICGATGMRI